MPGPNPAALRAIALATFLTLVPITLLVPGLTELVVDAHGGSRFQAHLFVSLNQFAGILAVPVVMVLHRRVPATRRWILALLGVNAIAFLGMRGASSLGVLFAWRAVDGMAHLPAVTLLMILANRFGGRRRGASLGVVASALMVGVGVGAPLGGILIDRDPPLVYSVGAVLLAVAAVTALAIPEGLREPAPAPHSRYRWDRTRLASWMPVAYGFADRFLIGVFVSTFTLFLTEVHGVAASTRGMLMSLFLLPFAALCWPAGRLADRIGWFGPIVTANILFGLVYASYGTLPVGLLPLAMVLSGVLSALMFAPSLVLVSEFARHGAGEGLFGVFQVAGSVGFLTGPLVGGVLVEVLRTGAGEPMWGAIFALVGVSLMVFGAASWAVLRPVAAAWDAAPGRRGGRANVPDMPPEVDARGNALTRGLATLAMKLAGWRFAGEPIPGIRRFVLIVAPHTSNWDFLVGVMAMYALGIRGTFLGKDTLFRFPLGVVMRFLGGVPVDRSSAHDLVTQTADLIARSERIVVVVAPEGTRKRTETWRSGFYWIAHRAKVPIVPVAFDYSRREVRILAPFTPTGDLAADVRAIRSTYDPSMARHPAQFGA